MAGNDRNYLWLLARTPTIEESERRRFLERAEALDFDTDALIDVVQDPAD